MCLVDGIALKARVGGNASSFSSFPANPVLQADDRATKRRREDRGAHGVLAGRVL